MRRSIILALALAIAILAAVGIASAGSATVAPHSSEIHKYNY